MASGSVSGSSVGAGVAVTWGAAPDEADGLPPVWDSTPLSRPVKPVSVIRPIRISRTAPMRVVYRTTLWYFLKRSSTVPVNSPTSRKGITKPRVYTPMSKNPRSGALEAMSSTPDSAGPTQGVQAKLKVKPRSSAVRGFMASRLRGRWKRCSLSIALLRPKMPSWYRPNTRISTPLHRVNRVRLPLKKRPSAVKPMPSRKKAKLMPSTKNRVLTSTRRRG